MKILFLAITNSSILLTQLLNFNSKVDKFEGQMKEAFNRLNFVADIITTAPKPGQEFHRPVRSRHSLSRISQQVDSSRANHFSSVSTIFRNIFLSFES